MTLHFTVKKNYTLALFFVHGTAVSCIWPLSLLCVFVGVPYLSFHCGQIHRFHAIR
uniref:Uncharacterized protein n=1 Tax=Anguilla anguilla TaxID=7936 RepID=A0A0E9XVF8_ANGAN